MVFALPFMAELASDMDISVVSVSSTSLEVTGNTTDGEEFVFAGEDNSQHWNFAPFMAVVESPMRTLIPHIAILSEQNLVPPQSPLTDQRFRGY